MQIVPIIPQYAFSVEETLDVKGIAAVNAAKPVQERTLPPLIRYRHEHYENASLKVTADEKRQLAQLGERRVICRRVFQMDILAELRSQIDRRKRKQRSTDLLLHIDEEA